MCKDSGDYGSYIPMTRYSGLIAALQAQGTARRGGRDGRRSSQGEPATKDEQELETRNTSPSSGSIAFERGRLDEAERLFAQSLEVRRTLHEYTVPESELAGSRGFGSRRARARTPTSWRAAPPKALPRPAAIPIRRRRKRRRPRRSSVGAPRRGREKRRCGPPARRREDAQRRAGLGAPRRSSSRPSGAATPTPGAPTSRPREAGSPGKRAGRTCCSRRGSPPSSSIRTLVPDPLRRLPSPPTPTRSVSNGSPATPSGSRPRVRAEEGLRSSVSARRRLYAGVRSA